MSTLSERPARMRSGRTSSRYRHNAGTRASGPTPQKVVWPDHESMEICEQCKFRYDDVASEEIAGRLRTGPAGYRSALSGASPHAVTRRPEPEVWSALEYACHVRDVLLIQRDRAVSAQVEELPSVARMHRDERVSLCGYARHPIDEVLAQLDMAAGLCAMVFDRLDDTAWSRQLVYNWPTASEHDLRWLGRHTVHEVEHHLGDVVAVLSWADDPIRPGLGA